MKLLYTHYKYFDTSAKKLSLENIRESLCDVDSDLEKFKGKEEKN